MTAPAWHLALDLRPSARTPMFQQIAEAVVEAIRDGRLSPGDRLPGSRPLAESLDVHRNTVLTAFDELRAQGWTEGAHGRGTFVSSRLPEVQPARSKSARKRLPARLGFDLAPHRTSAQSQLYTRPTNQRVINMAGGVPDLRLAPAVELARAYGRVLRSKHAAASLDYADARGHERLRVELANMLNSLRGLACTAADVVITRGSQMALYLVARALIQPGAVVAVEAFGYSPAWDAFRAAGARLVAVPVDRGGMRVDRLEALAKKHRIAAVYTTPHHQYPTTAVLSAPRRQRLLALAKRHRFAIVEDDYDHEVHYEGRPVLPIASGDTSGNVVYVGTLSKVLAPGVRIGYVVAPAPLLERIASLRLSIDRQGDPAVELAVAELLEDGVVQRHARTMRRVYRSRRDALAEALTARLGDTVFFDVPRGGMALWLRVAEHVDVDTWCERAPDHGVEFRAGRAFTFDGRSRPFMRLAYAARTEAELRRGVGRLLRALP